MLLAKEPKDILYSLFVGHKVVLLERHLKTFAD